MKHHEFSPSKLEQYRLCPGSFYMQKDIPEKPSEWAKEGTLLHKAVETGNLEGLDSSQIDLVESCRGFARYLCSDEALVSHEERFSITDDDGTELTFGTADLVILDNGHLTVVDWKFGYTPVNEVSRNIQLATYALGAMLKYGQSECTCIVYQPRLHQKSEYIFGNTTAIRANIKDIIRRAKSESLTLNPSEEACRFCRARLDCPAFRLKFQKLSASRGTYDLNNTNTLIELYEVSRLLKTQINEIEENIKSVIERDGSCGKYIFQVSEGAREVKDLNALYGIYKELITPQEFNSICKLSLGKFENLVADKLIAQGKACGETITKKDAKSAINGCIKHLVTRGNPIKKIVEG